MNTKIVPSLVSVLVGFAVLGFTSCASNKSNVTVGQSDPSMWAVENGRPCPPSRCNATRASLLATSNVSVDQSNHFQMPINISIGLERRGYGGYGRACPPQRGYAQQRRPMPRYAQGPQMRHPQVRCNYQRPCGQSACQRCVPMHRTCGRRHAPGPCPGHGGGHHPQQGYGGNQPINLGGANPINNSGGFYNGGGQMGFPQQGYGQGGYPQSGYGQGGQLPPNWGSNMPWMASQRNPSGSRGTWTGRATGPSWLSR